MSVPGKTGEDVSNRLKSMLEFNSSIRKKLQEKGKTTPAAGGESSSTVTAEPVATRSRRLPSVFATGWCAPHHGVTADLRFACSIAAVVSAT